MPPPFTVDAECKRAPDAAAGACADNGVDNSDSDSEDLGPETAVDAEIEADEVMAEPATLPVADEGNTCLEEGLYIASRKSGYSDWHSKDRGPEMAVDAEVEADDALAEPAALPAADEACLITV